MNCNHLLGVLQSDKCTLGGRLPEETVDDKRTKTGMPYKDVCGKCGAKRVDSQLGLEKTPEEYVLKLVEVFREVRRVLKKEGTLWLNLGDSYAGSGRGRDADGSWNPGKGGSKQETNTGAIIGRVVNPNSLSKNLIEKGAIGNAWVKPPVGLKPKDMIGIPWRVAFALQADGWYLRQDIIWSKPACMPESVSDRCTKSHEYVFLLAKSKQYFYDNEAIKEKSTYSDNRHGCGRFEYSNRLTKCGVVVNDNRNKRSVWTVNVHGFMDAHFATFPEMLIEPMVKAGCPEGGIVLDPFMGSGTTAVVVRKLGRHFIGFDLNPAYCEMATKRVKPFLEQKRIFEGEL